MVVIVNGLGTAESTMFAKSFGLSCDDAADNDD